MSIVATDPLAFLAGGGEAARMIRARDWSSHPLGPPEHWPQDLRVALGLVLNSPESMILAWGPDLHFFFNDTYFPLLGPRLAWAMGERFDKVWADAWEQAKPIVDEAIAGRARRFVDLPWKLDTDRGVADTWWTFSYSRVLAADGSVAGLFILTNETTTRVLADAALRESEQRLRMEVERQRHSLQQMPGFVAVLAGPRHVYAYLNDAYVAIAGRREFIGRTVREVFPELEGQGFFELLDGVYATGTPFSASAMPIRLAGDDAPRFIDLLYQAIRDDGGAISGVFVGGYDVTERVRAERALAALNASLQTLVEERTRERERMWTLSRDLYLVIGLDGTYKALNPTWERAFGHAPGTLLGIRFDELVHPDDRADIQAKAEAMREGAPVIDMACRLRRADGEYRHTVWTAVATGSAYYCTGRDVTEQRQVEEALRQAQKMEAVGQLTGGLAHDFNNLLAGISGSLELINVRLSQGRVTEVDKYIAAALGATKRAAALTHRLLAFSRRQTLDPRPTDVNALIGEMEELIRRTVGPAVVVRVEGAAGAWPALVDPPQLENALLNLCINARDAMPDGGRLTIETANRWLDQRAAIEEDLPPGQYLALSVTDTGIGMTPEVIAKAFDPFFTTKPIGQGTGLGLSMIYGFAKQSGGQTRIRSEPGQGTTVFIFLPRHLGEADNLDPLDAQPAASEARRGETVLVVDDEPTVRMLVRDVLEELGCTAIEAADSAAGLKALQSEARIDLLVSDVGLPGGMNGRQMADAGRERRPSLKVLFITGYAESAAVGEGNLGPHTQVLTKPFAVDALAARIRELIGG